MYKYLHGYIKPKYGDKAKLCYTSTFSFIVHIILGNIYADVFIEAEKRLNTSNYEINGPLPLGKNKNVIELMNNELGGKMMKELVALRSKVNAYLAGNDHFDKNETAKRRV